MILGQENHGSHPIFSPPQKRKKKKKKISVILVDPMSLHNLQVAVI